MYNPKNSCLQSVLLSCKVIDKLRQRNKTQRNNNPRKILQTQRKALTSKGAQIKLKERRKMKIDKRKKLLNNLKDNGLENERKNNRSEKSGLVKIKQSKIKKLERKAEEQLANGYYDQHEKTLRQIEKLKTDIEKYLK